MGVVASAAAGDEAAFGRIVAMVLDGMPSSGYLMVTDKTGEMIVKAIGARSLRPSQLDDLGSACEPVIYVPWSALVSQVLDQLKVIDGKPINRIHVMGGGALGVLGGEVAVDIVYAGSCTGAKWHDIEMAAEVVRQALADGEVRLLVVGVEHEQTLGAGNESENLIEDFLLVDRGVVGVGGGGFGHGCWIITCGRAWKSKRQKICNVQS